MADVLAPPPPKSPRADVPVRRPGSVRRSTAVDMVFVDPEEPVDGTAARLVIVGAPAGITPGVAEFTVFGEVRRR